MFERLRDYFVNQIALQMRRPQPYKVSWKFVRYLMQGRDKFLTKNVIHLADIHPHHRILSLGCRGGYAIRQLYPFLEFSDGKLFIVERSRELAKEALKYCRLEIDTDKCELFSGHPSRLPFANNFFDRVIHTDDYYFWGDQIKCMKEIFRVCKPEAKIVCTLDIDWLKDMERRGFMEYGQIDPLNHLIIADSVGFTNLKFDYFTANQNKFVKEKQFQAIFYEKPTSEALALRPMISDEDLHNLKHLLVQMFNMNYRTEILNKINPRLTHDNTRYSLLADQ